jgi:hypothetical protein
MTKPRISIFPPASKAPNQHNEEQTMKSILIAIVLTATAGFAAKADTSLVLKPSAAQIKAAKALDNPDCPVTNEPNGSMGAGRTVIYQGKAVKLCCGGCVKKFAKDPAKFTAEAEKSAKPSEAKPATGHEGHDHP